MLWEWLLGCIRTLHLLTSPSQLRYLRRIARDAIRYHDVPLHQRTFVLLAGLPGAGKTTLCRRHPVLRHFAHFECDRLGLGIIRQWPWLVAGPSVSLLRIPRSLVLAAGVLMVFGRFARTHEAFTCDHVNCNWNRRVMMIWLARLLGYRVVIVQIDCPQAIRAQRIRTDPSRQRLYTPVQVEQSIQLPKLKRLQPPSPSEGDVYVWYQSDQLLPEQLVLPVNLQTAPQPIATASPG